LEGATILGDGGLYFDMAFSDGEAVDPFGKAFMLSLLVEGDL